MSADVIKNTVRYMLIRQMRTVKDQIEQRNHAIPMLERQLVEARGERKELTETLDGLFEFAVANNQVITHGDIEPPMQVINGCSPEPLPDPFSAAKDEAVQLIIDLRRIVGMGPSKVRVGQFDKVVKHADTFIAQHTDHDDELDDGDPF